MSDQRSYPIQCPKCGNPFEARLYESVNVTQDPELREALLQNRINRVECPACSFDFRVDKTLLYTDSEAGLMIYWIPVRDDRMGEGEDHFSELMQGLLKALPSDIRPPEVQLVFSRVELIERIFMAKAGLEPRVIEYIKFQIYSNNLKQVDPRTKRLLLNTEDSTEDHLFFVVQDAKTLGFESALQYPRETYAGLVEMFDDPERGVDLLELFPGPYVSARRHFLEEEPENE
ncbi:MAG TPA: CpXC domain-containing protein [Kiritimatiellia bacterium]|nr:CpXC domain-containing protein [Kiritimatiellia bacterium]